MLASIAAVFAGGPKTLTDARGKWRSSIQRQRIDGPVEVTLRGIVGDQATMSFHGGPEAALCVHPADHYRFWREQHAFPLEYGAVGENLTVDGLVEEDVCVGDIFLMGTVLAQVSGPRVPCAKQARHVGRPDWVKLTIRENRTGFYMRVLEPGILGPGDAWILRERFDEEASITRVNRCMYLDFDLAFARRMLQMKGLGDWWRQQAAKKLKAPGGGSPGMTG